MSVMIETLSSDLVFWSRAQFALTAAYHWIFVPLTIGLVFLIAVMESMYVRSGDEFWKRCCKFWSRLFAVNFAMGVATGIILEFQFGTNWSNYSWFVGDIFGAPLAIEGIFAFFMEACFIAVMFFGWDKVSKRFHLASTWLVFVGTCLSAWWILVANAWMQNPVGTQFNPDMVRNEMSDFWAVAFSKTAAVKFLHSVLSGLMLGAAFVTGVSAWFVLKNREKKFALSSIKLSSLVGLAATLLLILTGDMSAYDVSKNQPMKLAAIEGLYKGGTSQDLVAVGLLNPDKKTYDDGKEEFLFRISIPNMLSFLATRDFDGYVPGISDIIEGGYTDSDNQRALSFEEKQLKGRQAINSLALYRQAKAGKDTVAMNIHAKELNDNIACFGYGYIDKAEDSVPNVPLCFYSFRVMVLLGAYFVVFFALMLFLSKRDMLHKYGWTQYLAVVSIFLAYITAQSGWIVAEAGRQPWAIQDILPVGVGVSSVSVSGVQTTFMIFAILFTLMLSAMIGIMVKQIRKGPQNEQ